jgi:hypothetical protein
MARAQGQVPPNSSTGGSGSAVAGSTGRGSEAVHSSVRSHQRHKKVFGPDFEVEEALREYIKPDGTIGYRSTVGWYERVDNNGWRPLAERILLDEDPVTTMTRLRRQPLFHYNPAVRRWVKGYCTARTAFTGCSADLNVPSVVQSRPEMCWV